MSRRLPDILDTWGHTWTKTPGQRGWIGPAITDPEDPTLALSVAYKCIIRRDGRYVMLYPRRTLDRFGWDEDAAEGMTLTTADGTVIHLGDPDDEDDR